MPTLFRLFLVLCPGLLMLSAGVWLAWAQSSRLHGYEPVTATIQRVDQSPHPMGGHTPLVRYVHDGTGRQTVAHGVTPLGLGGSKQWAETVAIPWDTGASVQAYCNPTDPSEGFLVGRVYWGPYTLAALGLLAVLLPVSQLPRGILGRVAPAARKPNGHGWHPLPTDVPLRKLGLFEMAFGSVMALGLLGLGGHGWLATGSPRGDGWQDPVGYAFFPLAAVVLVVLIQGIRHARLASAAPLANVVCSRAEAMLHDKLVVRTENVPEGRVQTIRLALVFDRWHLFGHQRLFGLTQPITSEQASHEHQHVYELPRTRKPKRRPRFDRWTVPSESWALEMQCELDTGQTVVQRLPLLVADPAIKPYKLQHMNQGRSAA